MSDSLLEDAQEAFKKRLEDPFLLSFLVAFVAYNWRTLLYLVTPDLKAIDRIAYVDANWGWSLACPLISAVAFSFGYPYVGALVSAARRKVQVQLAEYVAGLAIDEVNRIKKKQYGELLTLAELAKHPDHTALEGLKNSLLEQVSIAWSFAIPKDDPRPHVVSPAETIPVPCFVHTPGDGTAYRIGEIPPKDKSRIGFALMYVGAGHVLVFVPKSHLPWPTKFEKGNVIGRVAGSGEIITSPPPTIDFYARLSPSSHEGLGFFEVAPEAGFPQPR